MLQDLRFALRTLLRSPGFTTTAVVTLALGIGVTSLMFSVVNAVLLRPLPYPGQDRLMLVFNVSKAAAESNTISASALDFDDYRSRAHSFEAMAGHVGTGFTFSGSGEPELAIGQMVTPDFFRVLGVQPSLGRAFTADEFSPGRENVIVLSQRLWKRRFGGDSSVVGTQVTVNSKPFTIVGVMPPGFDYPGRRYQLWVPLPSPRTADLPPINRSSHYLRIIARLKPSVTPAQAHAEIETIAGALAAQFPDSNGKMGARVTPMEDYAVRDVKTPLYVLLGAVGLVVLIA
jgi:predicted permease